MRRVLIVDDDAEQLEFYKSSMSLDDLQVLTAGSITDAMRLLSSNHCHYLLADIHLSPSNEDQEGIQLLEQAKALYPDLKCLAMSFDQRMKTWLEARAAGALYFLRKPIYGAEELRFALQFVDEQAGKSNDHSDSIEAEDNLIIADQLRKIARGLAQNKKISCVISGETGTGKEEFAKLIHEYRQQAEGALPFVAVNCAGLDDQLLQSLMFGHKRGAFSGADKTTDGFIAKANAGLLFLDEIHFLSLDCQAKLLRVLNDGSYYRLGDTTLMHAHFQVIAASSRPLESCVDKGQFLADLQGRLTGIDVHLQPFRDREAEWPQFLTLARKKFKLKLTSDEQKKLLQTLRSYNWPGNIREFFKVLESAAMVSEIMGESFFQSLEQLLHKKQRPKNSANDDVDEDLWPLQRVQNEDLPLQEVLDAVERYVIRQALRRHDKVNDAVESLGIGRNTLIRKRKQYNL